MRVKRALISCIPPPQEFIIPDSQDDRVCGA